ncbi:glycosyltransferase family 4 protein [Aestuariibacter sp. AA17]|uniref:Glycosyltransferase family 4 protein n=1 Tax=Fluctibacter corallii TaxID=2984329 RepID=A0ABT3ACN3_9ALTE|nr:glycosyltransferase family 4 protein [Aestuariibacter sp. AA17]MCV2886042.1 glycosyltransferase family 4 protein [Aestuariibacter sp. AA17]
MKILTVSSLYPNANEPKHGIFVRNRLTHLLKHFPDVEAKVIAPVPWFPIKLNWGPFAQYAKFAGVPAHEKRDGLDVYHPRYLVIPKIGMHLTPYFMRRSIEKQARKLIKQGYDFELIDGHYFFPDGVAIAGVAQSLSKPFTCTARGTDINLIPQQPKAREKITRVAELAGACITVCEALKTSLLSFARVGDKAFALRNGVDLGFFTPTNEREQQILKQQQWRVPNNKKLIVSVGHLVERKGHYLVIDAMKSLPDCHLVIAGDGPDRGALQKQVEEAGLASRVTFAGALSQDELKVLYQAADTLVLASSREGWANVLLEAMACGTAVVATNLWGTPEVVAKPEAGVLVERNVGALVQGINQLTASPPSRADTRAYAEGFDWYDTSKGQYDIFTRLVGKNT